MNKYNRDYEDWHRYGSDRGFFDRATDEIRSWFGDEDAERRRQEDQQMEHIRGPRRNRYERPQWQDRDYSGPSPRGSYSTEHGRFDEPVRHQRGLRRLSEYGERGLYGYGRRERSSMGRNDWGVGGRWHEEEPRGGRGYYGIGSEPEQQYYRESAYGWSEEPTGAPRFFDEPYGRSRSMRNFRGIGPKNYQRSDERISDEIHQLMTEHPELDATNIEVIVDSGVVTLTGDVESRWSKRLAEDLVDDVYGVKETRNELRVNNNLQHGSMSEREQFIRDRVGGNNR